MEVFNMEFFDSRFIETGLNAVGFTAAGLLWMLVYSFFSSRRKRSLARASQPEVALGCKTTSHPPVMPTAPPSPSEFVSLDSGSRSVSASVSLPAAVTGASIGGRRNRVEIIRIAREMVKNGVAQDMIMRTLPITDGELALLVKSAK